MILNSVDKKYLSNPNFIFGSISVMNRENLFNVLRITHNFLESPNNERAKSDIYKAFTSAFANMSHAFFSDVMYATMITLTELDGKKHTSFVRKVVNDPIFIDVMKTARLRIANTWKLCAITRHVGRLFNEETIISLLKSKISKSYFLVFGCHPVLLNHIDLQKKWLNYYAHSETISPAIGQFYVTDEAINKIPTSSAINFVHKFAEHYCLHEIYEESKFCFSLKTLKDILITTTVAYGKNPQIERSLKNIEHIKTRCSK